MTAGPEIAVTLGRCDEMRAEVLVHPGGDAPPECRLVGTLSGPWRGRDTTLPTTSRLVPVPRGSGPDGASRAVLTEPAYWTPALPNLYRLEARVTPPAAGESAVDAWIGLRRLGIRGRSLWLDGRRWVPRAVACGEGVREARAADVGLVVASPGDGLLDAADRVGVAVIAVLSPADLTPPRIAAIARHPAAVLAIVVGERTPPSAAVRRAKGTLQLGVAVPGGMPPGPTHDGFDFLAVTLPADARPDAGWRLPPTRPAVAWRRTPPADAGCSRAACDALQRALAAWGLEAGADRLPWDWAGYLVG